MNWSLLATICFILMLLFAAFQQETVVEQVIYVCCALHMLILQLRLTSATKEPTDD